MKIGLILPNLNGGGAERAIMNIGLGLEARGHEVHLILLSQKFHYQSELNTHLVTKKPPQKGFFGKRRAALALRKIYKNLSADGEFDLNISTLPYADEVVQLAKIPNVWYRIANTLSQEIEVIRERSPAKANTLLRRYQALYSNKKLIAISQGVKSDLTEQLDIYPKEMVMIHNGYSFEAIRQLADCQLPFDEPYIIHVGRFSKQKRHDVLFEAFSGLSLPHKLVLLTHESQELEKLVNNYGLADRVYIAGFQENPYPWIKGAELLVLCSDYEGLGNVLVESLILGTRIVSTDCHSGPREIVGNKAGECLVPTRDVYALREAINRSIHCEFELPDGFTERFSQENALDLYESCAS